MTTENTYVNITALPLATDLEFMNSVQSFLVDAESAELNLLQREGATAVIDLAVQFSQLGEGSDIEHVALSAKSCTRWFYCTRSLFICHIGI